MLHSALPASGGCGVGRPRDILKQGSFQCPVAGVSGLTLSLWSNWVRFPKIPLQGRLALRGIKSICVGVLVTNSREHSCCLVRGPAIVTGFHCKVSWPIPNPHLRSIK